MFPTASLRTTLFVGHLINRAKCQWAVTLAARSASRLSGAFPPQNHDSAFHVRTRKTVTTASCHNDWLSQHWLKYQATPVRRYSSQTPEQDDQTVNFETLVSLIESGRIQLFDVREPKELESTGKIPGSVNLPLGEVAEAFDLTPEQFQEKYGAKKPEKTDKDITFSCLAGIRSMYALNAAVEKGYIHARHFPGGWEEWFHKKIAQGN